MFKSLASNASTLKFAQAVAPRELRAARAAATTGRRSLTVVAGESKISKIHAREIIDSRGNPTVVRERL